MNAFDVFLVVLLGACALRGWVKGLIALATQVVGLIAGVVLCRLMAHTVATIIGSGDDYNATLVIANVVLFAIAYIACLFAGRIIRSALHCLHLGIIDRLGGLIFSALEIAMVLSLLMNLWYIVLPDSAPASPTTAGFRGIIYNVAPTILGYLH